MNKKDLAMTVLRLGVLISVVALTVVGQENSSRPTLVPPASCPVTVAPANPFRPPAWYEPADDEFWLGSEKLWTQGNKSGVWEWEPHKPGHEHEVQPLTVKISWGSVDYYWRNEPRPSLTITGKRLDGEAPPLLLMPMTHILPGPGPNGGPGTMLAGVYVPTPGCWEITGEYRGEKVSFVVWVQPVQQGKQ
jgi:hypothetical protein